ncbi:MAG: hypothetical protein U0625_12735 [Phycisphaerales bacterium]
MIDGTVHNDAEEIRRFVIELQRYLDRVMDFDQRMTHELGLLGDTFRDDGFDELCQAFALSQRKLRVFEASVRDTIPELLKDAQAIDDYRRQRIDP